MATQRDGGGDNGGGAGDWPPPSRRVWRSTSPLAQDHEQLWRRSSSSSGGSSGVDGAGSDGGGGGGGIPGFGGSKLRLHTGSASGTRRRQQQDGQQQQFEPEEDRDDDSLRFCDYKLPFDDPDIPYEPGRTLDVDARTWRYYTDHDNFQAHGWVERCTCWLLDCCMGGRRRQRRWHQQWKQRRRKLRRQQRQQQQQQSLTQMDDVESQKAAAAAAAGAADAGGSSQQEQQQQQQQEWRHRSLLGLAIMSPESKPVRVWDTIMSCLDLTYTAYLVPLSLAFDSLEGAHFTWFNGVNVAGTAFYLADILMGFHTGFICRFDVRQALIMEGPKVADYYIRHGSFWLDLIATLPIIPELVLSAIQSDTTAFKWFYTLRLLRLARVFRLLKVWGGTVFTNSLSRWLQQYMSTAALYLLNLMLALTVLVNLMGCIWWFLAEIEGLDNSWAAATDLRVSLLEASDPARWVASVYYAMTTMTTVGYGDITPVTPAEQAVATVFMAFSVFYFGFVINFVGDLIHGSSRKARQANVLRHKLEDVESWMQERHIPVVVQNKVRRYFVQVWAPHAGIDDAEYFEDLPVELRGEIVCGLAGDALRQSKMFQLLDHKMRAQLASVALPVRLVAGHNLFEEGDEADSFYILQEGEAVGFRGNHRVNMLHGPAVVGQAAVFSHYIEECRSRLHTVRAVTNCTLWEFRGAHLAKMLKHSPDFLPPLCRSYLQYLDDLQQRMEASGHPVSKRLRRIEQEIHNLLHKVESKLDRRSSDASTAAAGNTPLPGTPAASPSGSPRRAAPAASGSPAAGMSGGGDSGGGSGGGGSGQLARRSAASAFQPSEAIPEEEQLQLSDAPTAATGTAAGTAAGGGSVTAAAAVPASQGHAPAAAAAGPAWQPGAAGWPTWRPARQAAAGAAVGAAGPAGAADATGAAGAAGSETEEVPEEEQLP